MSHPGLLVRASLEDFNLVIFKSDKICSTESLLQLNLNAGECLSTG